MTEVMTNLGLFELATADLGFLTLAEDSWQDYFNFFDFDKGLDSVIYAWLAVGGTLFFFLRMVSMLLGDAFGGGDIDADIDVDDVGDGSGAFTIFSVFSVVSFCMGTGWMGLIALYQYKLGTGWTALLAFVFGVFCMMLASSMLFYMKRLDAAPRANYQTAIGKTAKVYMSIPAKGEGRGQVEVVISGKKRIIDASSSGEAIPAFKSVKVIEVRDDNSVIVEVVV